MPKTTHSKPPDPERETLKSRLTAIANQHKPYLPMQDNAFTKCSHVIAKAAVASGRPLPLPGAMLPPL
jgi:hypothetical protein